MPFTDVAPPEVKPAGTGISFALAISKRTSAARMTFNLRAQEEIFGTPIAGRKCFAKVGRGTDEGKLLLVLQDDGDLELKSSMKGSASVRMKAWDLLPKDKRPAAPCTYVGRQEGGYLFKLPDFCRPSGVGGKIEAEHGLRRGARPAA